MVGQSGGKAHGSGGTARRLEAARPARGDAERPRPQRRWLVQKCQPRGTRRRARRPGRAVGVGKIAGRRRHRRADQARRRRDPGRRPKAQARSRRSCDRDGIAYVPEDRHIQRPRPQPLGRGEPDHDRAPGPRPGRLGRSPTSQRRVPAMLVDSLEIVASSAAAARRATSRAGTSRRPCWAARSRPIRSHSCLCTRPPASTSPRRGPATRRSRRGPKSRYCVVSDDLDELAICDRVVVMFDGEIVVSSARSDRRRAGCDDGGGRSTVSKARGRAEAGAPPGLRVCSTGSAAARECFAPRVRARPCDRGDSDRRVARQRRLLDQAEPGQRAPAVVGARSPRARRGAGRPGRASSTCRSSRSSASRRWSVLGSWFRS